MRRTRHAGTIAAAILAAVVAAFAPSAGGEDIDIFASVPTDNDLPNVLIIWDNSANWGADIPVPNCSYSDGSGQPKPTSPNKEQGKKMAIEKCAIYNVIDALPLGPAGQARFNIGLMLFNESGADNGGYPRKQFLPLTAANKSLLKSTIAGITIGGDKGNAAAFTATLHEAYLMFSKSAPLVGTQGTKWDPNAVAGGRYVGPPGSGCGKNHIIFVANGSPGDNNTQTRELLRGVGGDTTPLVYPTSLITNSDQANWADEYARFLRGADVVSAKTGVQSVTTHAIAVTGASSDGLYPNFMRAMANQGGGQYYSASNVTDLAKYLLNIFNSIQAVNSVFASASLPISVNAQGTYKNQVFVGVFRPDNNARPRWVGNLKQYKIGYDRATDSLKLVDKNGDAALNSATGFFRPSAVSFWTSASEYWVNDPKGTPKSVSDSPDGEVVEKGAAAQRERSTWATSQADRKVYTCIGCVSGTNLTVGASERFVVGNTAITSARLGASADAERDALINWIRGTDNANDELGPGGSTTIRPSVHGDVLHSRPAVIDYGASTGTVLYYGSNDGLFRAVNGNQTGEGAGSELWSFVAEENLGKYKRIRDNLPEVQYPSTPTGVVAIPRDYFFDGPVTVYQKLSDSGGVERVIVYVTARRGGRFIYAFDVTNPTQPKMLWRASNASIPVLGQTWSEARVARVRGWENPVLIFGAGYDPAAEDAPTPGATTMGNAVLVLDAFTGALVKKFDADRSVAGPVALLDVDYDGNVDRLYAADVGGNVYRLDLETAAGNGAVAHWTIRKFASLNSPSSPRKFFYAPDLVQTRNFVAVQLGSGNRERPLLTVTDDRFFTVFDYQMSKGSMPAAAITASQLVPYSDDFVLNSTVAGCYLPLDTAGEKVVTASATTGGYTYFSTNRPTPPSSETCSTSLGVAKGYKVALFCGKAESIEFAGGGLPPSPVTGEVIVDVPPVAEPVNPDDPVETRRVPFIIGGFNLELSGLNVSKVPIAVDPTRRRVYWYAQPSR